MAISEEEGIRRMVRFAFSDDDGDLDLSALPEFAAALKKAEQRGYSRGLADGAERERAAVVKWLRKAPITTPATAVASLVEVGLHLAGESE